MPVKPPAPGAAGQGASRRSVVAATLAGMGLAASPVRAASIAKAASTAAYPPLPPPPLPGPPLPRQQSPAASQPAPVIASGGPGLGRIAASHGRLFGSAVKSDLLIKDPAYAAAITAECGLLMPDYETKMSILQPAQGKFNFTGLDALVAFAHARSLPVRGHALVWHQAIPDWAAKALAESPARAQGVLEQHIGRILAHTQGAIQDWDVANEVVADPAGSDTPQSGPGELRDSPWLQALGPGYIAMSLKMAKERNPAIRVAINEYGLEEAAPHHIEKRRRFLSLVRSLRRAGVPLDAVGLQGHLQMVQPFSPQPFTEFCRLLRAEGVELVVTEMDVREHWRIPDGFAARDQVVADRVKSFVNAALDGGVKTFITWGLEDKYSWLATEPHVKRQDGLEHRGLPLDDDGRRKLYWQVMADAFRRA